VATLLIDLDLDAPPREPVDAAGYERVRAIVWRGEQPVGQIAFQTAGVLAPERLLAEARGQLGDTPGSALPVVDPARLPMMSVVVCTRDRPDDLEECLRTLQAQADAPPHEILVVDNAPTNALTCKRVALFPGVRYTVEELPGLGFARNRGIREARGEIVAFLDDDALAPPGWLRALATVFALDPEVGVCGGPIVPPELETEAQELADLRSGGAQTFERQVYGPRAPEGWSSRQWPLLAGSLVGGGNLALRAELLRRLGGFDDALGPGTPATSGEDTDVVHRMVVAGHRLAFEPLALVRHHHRRDLAGLRRQLDYWGCGTVAFITKAGRTGRRDRSTALLTTGWLFAHHLRRLLAALRPASTRPFPPSLVLVELAGCVRGLWAYRQSERYVRRVRAKER